MRFTIIISSLFLAFPASVAVAQTTPTTAPASPSTTPAPAPAVAAPVQQIEVVGERSVNRIDRQVYDLKSDISTTNSSAAEALSNVPSVQVDPDGTVSLRGNQNVIIMIDGKPTAMLQGDNRGAALNAMPADFIESIEVINNPGAEFGNEGGGGPILNLITRRNRRPGGFGSITGNMGTEGRYNTGISGSYTTGLASIDSFLNFRHDGRGNISSIDRDETDPLTGLISPSTQSGSSNGLNNNLNFNSNFRYNVGQADRTGGSIGYQGGGRNSTSQAHYLDYAPDNTLTDDFTSNSASSGRARNLSGSLFFEHKFDDNDATLKTDWRVSSTRNPSDSQTLISYALSPTPQPDQLSFQHREPDIRISDFTSDYSRKLGNGTFTSGIKVVDTMQNFNTLYAAVDPVSGLQTVNPGLSNLFNLDEHVTAAYGTYEYTINEQWAVKSGLRVEHTVLDIDQITSNIQVTDDYTDVMPSAYLSYNLSKDSTLRFAYSHRLHRPNANSLNPYVVYVSPTDRSSGNPNLRPAQSNSFELGYETTLAGVKTDLRLFARNEYDVITQYQSLISDDLGQNLVLTTSENFGTNTTEGLEFVFNGKPLPDLTLNLSGNLRHVEQTQFAELGLPSTISGTTLAGRFRINYQVTTADQVQVAVNAQGKQIWAQGYREPNWTSNLTWQHKLTPRLILTLNGTDIFKTNRNESYTDSDVLRQVSITRFDGRIFYVGFRYQLGGTTGS